MRGWTPAQIIAVITALCSGVGGLLTSVAAFIKSVRNEARHDAEREAWADRTRVVVRDEIASVTGNGHSVPAEPAEDAS